MKYENNGATVELLINNQWMEMDSLTEIGPLVTNELFSSLYLGFDDGFILGLAWLFDNQPTKLTIKYANGSTLTADCLACEVLSEGVGLILSDIAKLKEEL